MHSPSCLPSYIYLYIYTKAVPINFTFEDLKNNASKKLNQLSKSLSFKSCWGCPAPKLEYRIKVGLQYHLCSKFTHKNKKWTSVWNQLPGRKLFLRRKVCDSWMLNRNRRLSSEGQQLIVAASRKVSASGQHLNPAGSLTSGRWQTDTFS